MFKDLLALWAHDFTTRASLIIRSKIVVEGIFDKNLGPRAQFAQCSIVAEPANSFDIVCKPVFEDKSIEKRYADFIILGILDVLMLSEPLGLNKALITIDNLEYDAIRSSQMAFREAGRDAGRKLLTAVTPILPTVKSSPFTINGPTNI